MTAADATHMWEPRAVSQAASPAAAAFDPALDEVERLFASARRGDGEATEALCRRMRPVLYRAAWSFLKDRDDADDVAQEALVRALTKRFVLVAKGSARGFMVRIASNLAKNRLRDQKRRRQILRDDEARAVEETLADAAQQPDHGLVSAEERARVEAVMSSLSERQGDVVRLRLLGEMSFAEVGAALGIKEENARVTFSQAKARLKGALATQAEGHGEGNQS